MNLFKMTCIFFLGILIASLLGLGINHTTKKESPKEELQISIKSESQILDFMTDSISENNLKKAINYYGLLYPEVVFSQAILETGRFRSPIFKKYNNLFGLYNSKKKDYFKFDHWSESVKAYKDYVQRKYNPPSCYYEFLEELPYAEDPLYLFKVKQIVREYENISIR